jgi:cell division cycle protein 20 (cofactor of APC complex)
MSTSGLLFADYHFPYSFSAADESLKFWKVFEKKGGSAAASREGPSTGGVKGEQLVKLMTIR